MTKVCKDVAKVSKVSDMVHVMKVDKVIDMKVERVADMKVDKVSNMKVDMVGDMKVADMVPDIKVADMKVEMVVRCRWVGIRGVRGVQVSGVIISCFNIKWYIYVF